jgi:hypothetical protein
MSIFAGGAYTPTSDSEKAFETYRYYLHSICECHRRYGRWTDFGNGVLAKTRVLQGLKSPDFAWVGRFLKIAWNTEFLISAGTRDAELARFSNQWTPIQCYYAAYGGAEAAGYALDGQRADGHEKALRKVTDYFIKAGVSPWNYAFRGPLGRGGDSVAPANFPPGLVVPHNFRRAGVRPYEMVAKCLKAEHRHRIDDQWKRGRDRKFNFDPGPTGLLHFLYRLRIRSNYRDIDAFISGAPDASIRSFGDSIRQITFYALLYLEIIVLRKIGKRALLGLIDTYVRQNARAKRLAARSRFYRSV